MTKEKIDLSILESFFSFGTHRLVIDDEKISYKGHTIELSEIQSLIYGSRPISFDMFTIGTSLKIGVRDKSEKEILIILKSYFGGYKEEHNEQFGEILDALWDRISTQLINNRIDLLEQGQSFKVGKCEISQQGITIGQSENGLIRWADCSFQKLYDRLSISSKTDHSLYTNLRYYDTWDAFILLRIMEWMLEEKRYEYLLGN